MLLMFILLGEKLRSPNQDEDPHPVPVDVMMTKERNKCREDEWSGWDNVLMGKESRFLSSGFPTTA